MAAIYLAPIGNTTVLIH